MREHFNPRHRPDGSNGFAHFWGNTVFLSVVFRSEGTNGVSLRKIRSKSWSSRGLQRCFLQTFEANPFPRLSPRAPTVFFANRALLGQNRFQVVVFRPEGSDGVSLEFAHFLGQNPRGLSPRAPTVANRALLGQIRIPRLSPRAPTVANRAFCGQIRIPRLSSRAPTVFSRILGKIDILLSLLHAV